jgi:hypothetical protein
LHVSAVEAQKQVLSVRLDGLENTSVESLSHSSRGCPRMSRLDLDPFADERLQAPRSPVQGVAFRHGDRIGRGYDSSE